MMQEFSIYSEARIYVTGETGRSKKMNPIEGSIKYYNPVKGVFE
jgi:hypothetical protein